METLSQYQNKLYNLTDFIQTSLDDNVNRYHVYDLSEPLSVDIRGKFNLIRIVKDVHRSICKINALRAMKGRVSVLDFLFEAKLMVTINNLNVIIDRFDEVVEEQKNKTDVQIFESLIFGIDDIDDMTEEEANVSVVTISQCVKMNLVFWKGVLRRREEINEQTKDFANVKNPSFFSQLDKYYEEYYQEHHVKLESDYIKKLFIKKLVPLFVSQDESTTLTWLSILQQQCEEYVNTPLEHIIDTDCEHFTTLENINVIETLLSNLHEKFVASVFDSIILINLIKSKINPSLKFKKISLYELREKLDVIVTHMSVQRHWFFVAKYLMKLQYINDGDFKSAASLIRSAYDDVPPIPIDPNDLSRMNVDIYAKDVDYWLGLDSNVLKAKDKQYLMILRTCKTVFS